MRFWMNRLKYYCGIDVHARTMHVCILNDAGTVVSEQALTTRSELFFKTIVLNEKTLALVMLDGLHDAHQCPRVQDFASSCLLDKRTKESAAKRDGTSGWKIDNAHLT